MERGFYRKEISPVIRDIVVDSIDLFGKCHRTLVIELSDAKLHRLALAFWTDDECSRDFLNEGTLCDENLNSATRIALREHHPENLADIGRLFIETLINYYRPKMQQFLDLMHDDLREQIEAEEYISSGHRQLVDEQTGERRWVR